MDYCNDCDSLIKYDHIVMNGPKLLIRCIDDQCKKTIIKDVNKDITVIENDYSGSDRVNNIRITDICHDPTVRRRIFMCPKEKKNREFAEYKPDPIKLRLCLVCTVCYHIIK